MKIVFDDEDNFTKSPYPTETVWELIKSHFAVETRLDLLTHCYAKFDKPFFAGLCLRLAEAARDDDQLCVQIFTDAGRALARSVLALLPNVNDELIKSGELSVVCVGSVWLSWDLLKNGFTKELNSKKINYDLCLKRLTQTMALGAVYLATDLIKFDLPRDYTKNYEVFYCYHQKTTPIATNGTKIL